MNETLLTDFLSASSHQDVVSLIEGHPILSQASNWFPVHTPMVCGDAISAVACSIHESVKRIVRIKCREMNLDERLMDAEPSAIRIALYPQAANWNTYASIGDVADSVRLGADGDRFATNLILSDEGLLEKWPPECPPTISFCGLGLLYAARNTTNFWEMILFRPHETNDGIEYCQISTSSTTALPFHAKATNVQKLFQFGLPVGGRSVISKDLLDQLQQTIHDSILPFCLHDQSNRYSFDRFLRKVSLGLEFKLRCNANKHFAYVNSDKVNGLTVNIYLFKLRIGQMHEQTTRHTLTKLYFKAGRHIVFLSQGLVVGQLGADFIEYTIGFRHLRNHLLVSVSEVKEKEIENLKLMIAGYLASNEVLLEMNKIYNEELTLD